MHYRNGREAKQGDRVIFLDPLSGKSESGILYSLSAQSDTCNGRLAKEASSDPYVNIKDCVHVDDVNAAFPKIK